MKFWLTIAFFILAHPATADNPLNFSKHPVGKTPNGFRVAGGTTNEWKVIEAEVPSSLDPSLMVKRRCLRHSGGTNNSTRYPSLVHTGESYEDLVIKTSFRINGGNGVQAAGVVIRAQPDNTSFIFAVIPANKAMYLTYCEKGVKFGGGSTHISLPKDGWYHLELTCQNNAINGRINGKSFEELKLIRNPPGPGKVGFWTRGDTDCLFTMSSVSLPMSFAQSVINEIVRTNKHLQRVELSAIRPGKKNPEVAAATNPKQVGQPAHASCLDTIENGTVIYSKSRDTIEVIMPVKNVDGKIIAAARMILKPGKFTTQTKNRALASAVAIELGRKIQTHAKLFR